MEHVVPICLGVALAATCGLRAFLPCLVVGVLARIGQVELADAFAWLTSTPALLALSVAVVLEVVGDKVPAVDNLLDLVQTPVRTGAGIGVCAAVAVDLPGWSRALLAVVAGGGAALTVHSGKSALRLGLTTLTGGLANPVISLLEDLLCLLATVLAVLFSAVAVVLALLALVLVVLAVRKALRWLRRRRRAPPEPAPQPPPA